MNKAGVSRITPMTNQEAVRILGLDEKNPNEIDFEEVQAQFERMFLQNDPEKGGSFYLQSKIYRAREQIEKDLLKSGGLTKEKVDAYRLVTQAVIARKPEPKSPQPEEKKE